MSQLTFVEQDAKDLVSFLNYIHSKAQFTVKPVEMQEYFDMYRKCVGIAKKVEDHILELKAVTEKPKDKKK